MKKISLLTFFFLTAINCFSQSIIITKSGDTINCVKYETKYPNTLYWINGSEKALRIKNIDIKKTIDFPVFELNKNEKDEFTGTTAKTTKDVNFGCSDGETSSKLKFWMAKFVTKDNLISYSIIINPGTDLGCSGAKDNYCIIKFQNDEIFRLENDRAEIDCGGCKSSIYRLDDDTIDLLKHNNIKAIRVRQSKYYLNYSTLFPDCVMKTIVLLDE